MAIKEFWNGMVERISLKKTDKLMVGNIDTNAAEHTTIQKLWNLFTTDDLAEGVTTKCYTNAEQAKMANVPADTNQELTTLTNNISTADGKAVAAQGDIDAHKVNLENPHQVDKSQVGLGNVDNTSDADKPVSSATTTALDLKADKVDTGDKAGLTTTDKSTIVAGVNEVNGKANDNANDIATAQAQADLGVSKADTAQRNQAPFADVAAATAYWDGLTTKPLDGSFIMIEADGQYYAWASGEASKVLPTSEYYQADSEPTKDSQKNVRSGGVFSGLEDAKAMAIIFSQVTF